MQSRRDLTVKWIERNARDLDVTLSRGVYTPERLAQVSQTSRRAESFARSIGITEQEMSQARVSGVERGLAIVDRINS